MLAGIQILMGAAHNHNISLAILAFYLGGQTYRRLLLLKIRRCRFVGLFIAPQLVSWCAFWPHAHKESRLGGVTVDMQRTCSSRAQRMESGC